MSATNFYRYPGGNTANVAIGLARLGVDVTLIAKIGTDFHGSYLRSVLSAEGVNLAGLIEDSRYPTAQCYMTVADDGGHIYRNWPKPHAADMLSEEDVCEEIFNSASLVHSSGISLVQAPRRDAVLRGLELSHRHDVLVSFDACFPSGQGGVAREAAMMMMERSHLVKMNLDELAFWSQMEQGTEMSVMVRKVFEVIRPVALIVTLGPGGAILYTPAGEVFCPAHKVAAVCDVGAGDAFMAGLIYTLVSKLSVTGQPARTEALRNLSLEDWRMAGNTGATCGALCTRAIGATETFPRLKDLEAESIQLRQF